jgi:hypothetical protein
MTNKEINFEMFSKELGCSRLEEVAKQRPDRQFWVEISESNEIMTPWKFFIIEIATPFGREDR